MRLGILVATGATFLVLAASTAQSQSLTSGVSEARISPDGTAVVFARAVSDPALQNLWFVDFAGSTPVELTPPDGRLSQIRWSPDGEMIAYLSRRDPRSTTQLRLVSARGGPARTMSGATVDVHSFEFSLDGRHIRFDFGEAGSPDAQSSVVETGTGGGAVGDFAPANVGDLSAAQLSPGPAAAVMFASAAGRSHQSFVLSDGDATWLDVVNLSTGARTTLMRPGMATIVAGPTWSSDASRFAVVAVPPGGVAEVFVGSLLTEVAGRPDWVGAASPRVRQITFGV